MILQSFVALFSQDRGLSPSCSAKIVPTVRSTHLPVPLHCYLYYRRCTSLLPLAFPIRHSSSSSPISRCGYHNPVLAGQHLIPNGNDLIIFPELLRGLLVVYLRSGSIVFLTGAND